MTENSLQVIEQKTVIFYEDELTAVVVDVGGKQEVYVPLKPICDYLGVDWPAQYQRIRRDLVLSETMRSIVVTTIDLDPSSSRPRTSEMSCLPLKYLNGFLFGVNAKRVKNELRERVIRYQRDCYEVLAQAFQSPAARPDAPSALLQVREMALAILTMSEEQIEFDRRLAVQEGRMEQAAVVVQDIRKRLTTVERKLTGGQVVTDEQASQIGQAVKALALTLGKKTGRNEFSGVYSALYQQFGITSYKMLPARHFDEAMKFLTNWYRDITGDADAPF
jgi:hypothetical protein